MPITSQSSWLQSVMSIVDILIYQYKVENLSAASYLLVKRECNDNIIMSQD